MADIQLMCRELGRRLSREATWTFTLRAMGSKGIGMQHGLVNYPKLAGNRFSVIDQYFSDKFRLLYNKRALRMQKHRQDTQTKYGKEQQHTDF